MCIEANSSCTNLDPKKTRLRKIGPKIELFLFFLILRFCQLLNQHPFNCEPDSDTFRFQIS